MEWYIPQPDDLVQRLERIWSGIAARNDWRIVEHVASFVDEAATRVLAQGRDDTEILERSLLHVYRCHLFAALRRGDDRAATELHQTCLLRARALHLSDSEAEDAAQETVSRVLARLEQIKAPEALVSYSLLVLRSVVKEGYQRPQEASLEAALVSGELPEPAADTIPADTVETAMVEDELRHMIDRVLDHPLERMAIERIVLGDDRPREVARELDLPLHRIRVHKSRALQRLRKDVEFMQRCAVLAGERYEGLVRAGLEVAEREVGDDE